MNAPELRTGADQIYLQLDSLSKKLIGLPVEIRDQMEGDLQKIRSSVNDLIQPSNEAREALERAVWLARFPDENPNPVARVSVDGKILYCNQVSSDPFGWGFQIGEQIPVTFHSFVEEASLQRKHIECELEVGQNIYSIVFMPFPNDQYVNLYGRDITHHKRVEAEQQRLAATIRQERDRLSALINSITDEIWFADADKKLTLVNPAGWKEFGEGIEDTKEIEKIAASFEVYQANGTLRSVGEAPPLRALRGETVFNEEELVRTPASGELRYRQVNAAPVRGPDGSIVGSVSVVRDITERKRSEAALEKAYHDLTNERNRLLAVMQSLPVGVTILDRQGGIIQINREYEAIWGGPPPVTQSVDDYTAYQAWWVDTGVPLKPEEWASAKAVQTGETVIGQFLKIKRFDGKRAFVLNSAAPILDANGENVGSAVAIMDITQRIEAENALRESQDRFRVAVSIAPILVYTCDRVMRYTWIYNPLRGFQADDVLGKRDDEVLPPEAAAEMIAAKQLALETGQGRTQEVKVPLNGEDTYYILTTDPIRDPQGNVTGLTCSAIDITEQKLLQSEQQEQAIQLELQRRLMEQREQDHHTIARDLHDGPIQTLSSIMFHLFMVKEAFPDPKLQEELGLMGTDIKNTIHQLRDTLNNLRPPALMQFGFSKVAKMYIEDFHSQYPDIEMNTAIEANDNILSSDAHLTLYRIFQAVMNNIIRHAEATKVWVSFKIEDESFIW